MPKKHNVAYIKPREPEFLARLKQEAGYIEGPTVDTKVGFNSYMPSLAYLSLETNPKFVFAGLKFHFIDPMIYLRDDSIQCHRNILGN